MSFAESSRDVVELLAVVSHLSESYKVSARLGIGTRRDCKMKAQMKANGIAFLVSVILTASGCLFESPGYSMDS